MFYYLLDWLRREFSLSGTGIIYYITFRAVLAAIVSLLITIFIGKKIIRYLQKKQIGETVRTLGLTNEQTKVGTPTMGGIIIIAGIIIPTLLFAKIHNVYIVLMILSTLWLGTIGFIDDYIKVFKKDKAGLAGKFKIIGQIGLGLIVGITLYFNSHVTILRHIPNQPHLTRMEKVEKKVDSTITYIYNIPFQAVKSPATTIPFQKNHEFNYSDLLTMFSQDLAPYTWIVYVLVVTFIIIAVSNGANLTDGLDGLAAGTSAIMGAGLGIFAYVSSNYNYADYLNIMFIPNLGELSIFIASFVGACVGFLWYNAYPAKVFMGDTGSLTLGGIIAALAIIIRKELLIPIICGIFLVENLSVIIQVVYFKYTKKKYGEGRRVFLMSPLHHHYQKKGYHENLIVVRFWIIAILCVVLSVITLKIR